MKQYFPVKYEDGLLFVPGRHQKQFPLRSLRTFSAFPSPTRSSDGHRINSVLFDLVPGGNGCIHPQLLWR